MRSLRDPGPSGAWTLSAGLVVAIAVLVAGAVPLFSRGLPPRSAAPPAPDGADGLHLEVVRLKGPDNTALTLEADGTLRRFDGSHLVVREWRAGVLDLEATAFLLERSAAVLTAPSETDAPVEGDLYLLVVDGQVRASAVEAQASPELLSLATDLLAAAERIPTQDDRAYFLRAEPVDAERAKRLAQGGAAAHSLTDRDQPIANMLAIAIERPFHFHRLEHGLFQGLHNLFEGREGFVVDTHGAWHQLGLWAPP